MNNRLLLTALLLIPFASHSQDAEKILKASFAKLSDMPSGYFEVHRYTKAPGMNNTFDIVTKFAFRKTSGDSLSPALYHATLFSKGKYLEELLYTGNEFAKMTAYDSTGDISTNERWAKYIKSLSIFQNTYPPITDKNSYPVAHPEGEDAPACLFKFNGIDTVNGDPCYHIQVNEILDNDSTKDIRLLKMEYHYWVRTTDSIPMQLTNDYKQLMANDTLVFHEKCTLEKFTKEPPDESQFSLASIPSFYTLKNHAESKRRALLLADTLAPAWTLPSIQGTPVSLASLKGKVVLIDFFYRTCYPCMLAVPKLEALNKKYKDKGLVVIGIDPFDKKDSDIGGFLVRKGITYTVLLDDINVAGNSVKNYHIGGFPTMYLIDRNGKIVSSEVGYGPNLETSLDAAIRPLLGNL